MRPHKGTGDDNLQPILVKNSPKKMIVQLYYVYKQCLKKQNLPRDLEECHHYPTKVTWKEKRQPQLVQANISSTGNGKSARKNIIRPEQFAF